MTTAPPTPLSTNLGEIVEHAMKRVFLTTWSDELHAYVRRAGKRYLDRLTRLRAATLNGTKAQVRARLYRLEASYEARFCAYVLAYPNGRPAMTLAEVEAEVALVGLRKPSGEAVRVIVQAKPEGGSRPTVHFSPRARAAQRLLRDALHAMWGDSDFEYARSGRGRDALIRELQSAHKNHGVRRIVEVDVAAYFPSFNKEVLHKILRLPKAMVENTICIPADTTIVLPKNTDFDENTVRAGLPMGSLLSPFVASKLLEPTLSGVPGRVVAYIDNIFVGVGSSDEAEAAMKALADALHQHPAGPFKTKYAVVSKLGDRANYLGYEFARRPQSFGGHLAPRPSRAAIRRFQRRVACQLVVTNPDDHSGRIEVAADGWAASFGLWGGRYHGADLAVVGLVVDVMPLVRKFWQKSIADDHEFSSMQEIVTSFCATTLTHSALSPTAASIPVPKSPPSACTPLQ